MQTELFDDKIRTYILNTAVVGSGAAGLNAADRLWALGVRDMALVTEGMNSGTSRNTGSDKQTYYKLTLSGEEPDSVREMAQTLFDGRCVDGDTALCEAALSAQGFYKLLELGVPFPRSRYGEAVGYKTDHDPRRRATSVGPYTSRSMTQCLEKAVREKGVPILDKLQIIRILSTENGVCGLLCIDKTVQQSTLDRFVLIHCKNVIYATGGPAGMYADSVYPFGHYGASGLAFEAGVLGKNLTEWQYGLASVCPRWNVSGTYMQVLPRFISTDKDGGDEREFLFDFFTDISDMQSKIFLKGYQWPFDVRKIDGGSSIIDILVYLETCKGRRVFLDYRKNAGGKPVDFSSLGAEAREYLEKAEACFGTPLERLMHMNAPAVEFYRDKGVDLAKEPLEIALCAQHNNGGLSGDAWWQTNLDGFFAVGEVNGSHGVYRPGGSALNAGQVGSTRAAQFVAAKRQGMPQNDAFENCARQAIDDMDEIAQNAIKNVSGTPVQKLWDEAAARMSLAGASLRSEKAIRKAAQDTQKLIKAFSSTAKAETALELPKLYRLRDMLMCQYVYLSAMLDYLENGGKSRGSALYTDAAGKKPYAALPDEYTFILDDGSRGSLIQEVRYKDGKCEFSWRNTRPIPTDDDFFENIWRGFRQNANIY
ncbi:MAG: FAD-binding protein [Clostridia bacterium]|nr:FAD-binding protein [Clostridia bacterium]NLS84457.1 FAD-binding protein [Oscillospiraceae bacterium]